MKRSHYLFFGTIVSLFAMVLIDLFFNLKIPNLVYFSFLVPVIIVALTQEFLPNCKFSNWFKK